LRTPDEREGKTDFDFDFDFENSKNSRKRRFLITVESIPAESQRDSV